MFSKRKAVHVVTVLLGSLRSGRLFCCNFSVLSLQEEVQTRFQPSASVPAPKWTPNPACCLVCKG